MTDNHPLQPVEAGLGDGGGEQFQWISSSLVDFATVIAARPARAEPPCPQCGSVLHGVS